MSKTHILWLAHEGSLSGANICLLEHFQILKQNGGFDITLVVPRVGRLSQKAEQLGIPSKCVPFYSWAVPFNPNYKEKFSQKIRKRLRNLIALWHLKSIIHKFKPNYIATNTITINIGAIAASHSKLRHVWFVHEFGEADHGFSLPGGMECAKRWIGMMSEKVAVNSIAMANFYKASIPEFKIHLVHNPVLINAEVNKPKIKKVNEPIHFVMLGQIAAGKNQLDAIKAIAKCRELSYDCMLTIAGSIVNSDYKKCIDNELALYKLDKYVKVMPPIQDIYSFFSGADALLMCSRMEAFGRVAVEALKMGIPVIAADTGASTEIINEGVNGLLYKSGDVNSLVQTIGRFIKTSDLYDSQTISKAANDAFNESLVESQLLKVFN